MNPLLGTESAKNAVTRIHYTHDAMIDIVIARPDISQNQLAAHFGYTVPWISRVFCSDAFQARLAERRTEVCTPGIIASFEEKLKGLASQSLEVLTERLARMGDPDSESAKTQIALKTLELTAKSLGYGARQTNVAVQTNFVVAMPGKTEDPQTWATQCKTVASTPLPGHLTTCAV